MNYRIETNRSGRLEWVDAMRGFSMLIVVLGHVLIQMGVGGYSSFLSSVLLTFRMPLFFFVSGFFSYRAITWWNGSRVYDIIKRKFQAQILCTIIFYSVFQYDMGGNINFSHGFGGYWFTIVLFQMYLIYLSLSLFSRCISKNIVIKSLILISVIFIGILLVYDRSAHIWEILCWENLTKYTQFFTVGIICSKYRNRFFELIDKNYFRTIMICGWIISMLIWYNSDIKDNWPYFYSIVHDILVRYFALLTVIICFFSKREGLSSETKISRCLKYIGRRTLDIYMIHYFFLPNMTFFEEYLQGGNTLVIQLMISGLMTAIIVALCLLISGILRKSPTLETWLFGVKRRREVKLII